MGGHVLATCCEVPHPVSRIPQRGALRLSSKAVPEKEADGREAAALGNAQRRKDYTTQARHRVWEAISQRDYPYIIEGVSMLLGFFTSLSHVKHAFENKSERSE